MVTYLALFISSFFFKKDFDGYLILRTVRTKCDDCVSYDLKRRLSGTFLVDNDAELSKFIEYYQNDSNRIFIETFGFPDPSKINFNTLIFTRDLSDQKTELLKTKIFGLNNNNLDCFLLEKKMNSAADFIDELLQKNDLFLKDGNVSEENIIVIKVKLKLYEGALIGEEPTNNFRKFIGYANTEKFKNFILIDYDSLNIKPLFSLIPIH